MESASAISNALSFENNVNIKQNKEELDNDIEKLERLLEEKRQQKRKKSKDFEM